MDDSAGIDKQPAETVHKCDTVTLTCLQDNVIVNVWKCAKFNLKIIVSSMSYQSIDRKAVGKLS